MPPPEIRIRVAAVLERGDSVLLVRHVKAERTYWLFPGGGVERGETLAQALQREMLEEVGLRVRVGRLLLVCEAIDPAGSRHIVNLYFRTRQRGRGEEPRLSPDPVLAEAAWQPWQSLAQLETYPPVGRQLLEMRRAGFRGRTRSLGNSWR